jgi:hypothetical protein
MVDVVDDMNEKWRNRVMECNELVYIVILPIKENQPNHTTPQ